MDVCATKSDSLEKQTQTVQETSKRAEVSISEQLAVQRASLDKKHQADIEYYQNLVKSLQENSKGKGRGSGSPGVKHTEGTGEVFEGIVSLVKLERYQLIKSISVYMADWLESVKPCLSKDMLCDLTERISIDTLDKVDSWLSAFQTFASIWYCSRPSR